METVDGVKLFKQFGFKPLEKSGKHVIGECVFCGNNKFYINESTLQWDCKSCGANGNKASFPEKLYGHCKEYMSNKVLKKFAKQKSLTLKHLLPNKNILGYHPKFKYLLFPVFDYSGSKIISIRKYDGKKFLASKFSKLGMIGWENVSQSNIIYIVEGEWDYMVMDYILKKNGSLNTSVVGLVGSASFKAEWASMFDNKHVICLLDNDEAGEKGNLKLYKMFRNISSIKFLIWEENKKEKYDIRDLFIDSEYKAITSFMYISDNLQDKPKGVEVVEIKNEITYTGSHRVKRKDVIEAYTKWLHLKDTDVIDIMYGSIIANRMEGEPIWLFLVAPPGGTKSELIMALNNCIEIMAISSLTPHTLVSGMKGENGYDPSLLPKLNGKVLCIKDFTAILSLNKFQRDEIFGILRDAFDGEYSKPFGNGQWVEYKSKFGILTGVTPAIESFTNENALLGERFLRYTIKTSNSFEGKKAILRKALNNSNRETTMKDDLLKISEEVLNYDYLKTIPPEVSEKMQDKIISLSLWVSALRGSVLRDKYSKEILLKPYIELGTRVSKQLNKLAYGLSYFKNHSKVKRSSYNILKKVAISSVPSHINDIVKLLYTDFSKSGALIDTKFISDRTRMPQISVERNLEDLYLLGVLTKASNNMMRNSWKLKREFLAILAESEVYSDSE